jgi:addiction module HigA family antidote
MIQSFADEETEAVFLTGKSRRWARMARVAARRLQALDYASAVEDLREPPGNRLEKLKGDRKGFWSIRINEQCRICFRWDGQDARFLTITKIARMGSMSIPRKPEQRGVPVHPGEFLREDFLVPLGLSANALALALRVPVTRVSEIVRERRGITADTALRLARYFGTTPDFWMKMQMSYDLALADRESKTRIEREIFPAPRTETGALKIRQIA